MSEVMAQFEPLTDETGRTYVVRVCGRVADDGLWEGWVEFEPEDGGPTLRTRRETEQSDRGDLQYWASGLTVSYLEGALDRARLETSVPTRPTPTRSSDEGRAASGTGRAPPAEPRIRPRAVLDPFDIYGQGEDVLREELGALDNGHLINIIRAYSLVNDNETDLHSLDRAGLAKIIVEAVQERVG